MKKVYIASPYTLGDVAQNVRRQIDAADTLMKYGFAPHVPLLSHFWHFVHPHLHSEWLEQDIVWLKSCDYVLRLDGESTGADKEVEIALANDIPVFYLFGDLLKWNTMNS